MENVEKKEKKENEELGAEPVSKKGPTLQSLLRVIQSNADATARKALEKLVKKGCDQNRIIELVYHYCRGASPNETKAAVKAAGNSVKRWEALCERLREDADQIERTIAELDKKGIARSHYPPNQHPAESAREFADHLAAFCQSLKPRVNLKSGSTETLVYLCYLVKAATKGTQYPKIAALIRAFQQSEKPVAKVADAIRSRVNRFEKENTVKGRKQVPLREEAKDEVAEWRRLSPKKKVPSRKRKNKTL
jgi:hypothetical protein